jgi:hypothetical protein
MSLVELKKPPPLEFVGFTLFVRFFAVVEMFP